MNVKLRSETRFFQSGSTFICQKLIDIDPGWRMLYRIQHGIDAGGGAFRLNEAFVVLCLERCN